MKWDACIRHSMNRLIYAESVYLDHMAVNWDAIVLNDYEAVMPLPWKKKLGIRYLYQPSFFQQGGIFSRNFVTQDMLNAFIKLASGHFRFAETTLNYACIPDQKSPDFQTTLRNNFILSLEDDYTTISGHYSNYIKQRLKRLAKYCLQYKKTDESTAAVRLYKKLYQERLPAFSNKDYLNFSLLCEQYAHSGRLLVREVYDTEGNNLLATVLLLKDESRLYNMASSLLPEGKKLLANYFLYDALIREFAGKGLLLDFEGSDVAGIAYFYKKFTDLNQPYPFIRFNLLPAPFKILKR